MRLFVMFAFLFSSTTMATDLVAEVCHYVVSVNDLEQTEVNGQIVFTFNENVIDKSKNEGCFYPVQTAQLIQKLLKEAEDYQKISHEYKRLTEKVETMNREYASLIKAHEAALDRSVNLTESYRKQVEEYKGLVADYDRLVIKFDKLAAEYRDVALSTTSFLSFDIGAGATSDKGGAGLVGLGIRLGFLCQQLKLWGIYQQDNSGGMIGCSFGF